MRRLKNYVHHSNRCNTSRFIKIRSVGNALFHADGQTDMTKLVLAFRNFANAPKNKTKTF